MNDNAELIAQVEGYCTRQNIAESTFGFRAVNDGKLVARLREGKTITLAKFRAIETFLNEEPKSEGAE